MATQKINAEEKSVTISNMSVAGGDLKLPDGQKYFVNITLDFSNVAFDQAIGLASEGSSMRVKAQAKLRKDEALLKEKGVIAESAADVNPTEVITFDVSTDFERAETTRDPAKQASSAYKKMDLEQKAKFIAETLGVDIAEARLMVKNES